MCCFIEAVVLEGFANAAARILHTIHVSEGECSPKEGKCECSVSYSGASSSRLCPNPRPRRVCVLMPVLGAPRYASAPESACTRCNICSSPLTGQTLLANGGSDLPA